MMQQRIQKTRVFKSQIAPTIQASWHDNILIFE